MKITLIGSPDDKAWLGVKQRALVTIGKEAKTPPDSQWKHDILVSKHSPIRYLMFSFYIEGIPSWVSVHLTRHKHAEPYVKSQRNDRQGDYDRNDAPQNAPVNMIWDLNAEELMTVANKRLCSCASPETRQVVMEICRLAEEAVPELRGLLVPYCAANNGKCNEVFSDCERYKAYLK